MGIYIFNDCSFSEKYLNSWLLMLFSHAQHFATLWTAAPQPSCPSLSPRVCPRSSTSRSSRNLYSPSDVSVYLSHVWLFETPWTAARQASLSFTVSWSLFKLMSIESMMPSNHLILCHPFLLLPSIFPSIKVPFPMSWLFTSGGHSIGMSTSASVLPMNIQGRFPLGLIGLISLQSKGLLRVFSNTRFQKHQVFSTQLSL